MESVLLLSNHTKSILSMLVDKLKWGDLAAGTDPRAARESPIQTQEYPSQDVPAGTSTYPALSSTSHTGN